MLSNADTVSGTHHTTESIGVDYFLQALREMSVPDYARQDSRAESRTSGGLLFVVVVVVCVHVCMCVCMLVCVGSVSYTHLTLPTIDDV